MAGTDVLVPYCTPRVPPGIGVAIEECITTEGSALLELVTHLCTWLFYAVASFYRRRVKCCLFIAFFDIGLYAF